MDRYLSVCCCNLIKAQGSANSGLSLGGSLSSLHETHSDSVAHVRGPRLQEQEYNRQKGSGGKKGDSGKNEHRMS